MSTAVDFRVILREQKIGIRCMAVFIFAEKDRKDTGKKFYGSIYNLLLG